MKIIPASHGDANARLSNGHAVRFHFVYHRTLFRRRRVYIERVRRSEINLGDLAIKELLHPLNCGRIIREEKAPGGLVFPHIDLPGDDVPIDLRVRQLIQVNTTASATEHLLRVADEHIWTGWLFLKDATKEGLLEKARK